jgi:hypothetical protein
VIGAARSGTTSLYRVLARHPEVFVPETKEPRFFNRNWDKGWDWYRELYRDAPPDRVAGDFSPSYSNARGRNAAAERIARAYPQARIVYLVRNPIDCAISNWRMTAETLGKALPFGDALADPAWSTSVLHRVMFFRQLGEYRRLFPEEQILVAPLEALRHDGGATLAAIQRHIGVGVRDIRFPKGNASDRKPGRPGFPEITPPERRAFLDLVAPDAAALLAHLGLAADTWRLGVHAPNWEPRPKPRPEPTAESMAGPAAGPAPAAGADRSGKI